MQHKRRPAILIPPQEVTWKDARNATIGGIGIVVVLALGMKYLGPIILPYILVQ